MRALNKDISVHFLHTDLTRAFDTINIHLLLRKKRPDIWRFFKSNAFIGISNTFLAAPSGHCWYLHYITLHFGWVISPLPRKSMWPQSAGTLDSPLDRGLPVWHLDSKFIVPAPLAQRPSFPHNDLPLLRMSPGGGSESSPSDACNNTRGPTSQ